MSQIKIGTILVTIKPCQHQVIAAMLPSSGDSMDLKMPQQRLCKLNRNFKKLANPQKNQMNSNLLIPQSKRMF
jgi:hypothetical protein